MSIEEVARQFTLKPLPHCEIELAGTIPYESLEPFREEALKEIAGGMELSGFRKGRVPEHIVLQKMGEMMVLEEAARHFARRFYPVLIAEKKIDAVGRPAIQITKIAPRQPVSLVIRTAVYPEIKIPENYQGLAKNIAFIEPDPVTDEEFANALEQLQKSRAAKNAGGSERIPELDDEFAKSVGVFESLEDLKNKLREGIAEEKARAAREKRRSAIIETLLEKTSMDMPLIFIESELEKIVAQIQGDVTKLGLEFTEYLNRIGKTEEKLREELRPAAEKRAKIQLMLNELAKKEHVEPEPVDIEREFNHTLEHFPNADKEALHIHIETMLRNEKVFQLLEALKS